MLKPTCSPQELFVRKKWLNITDIFVRVLLNWGQKLKPNSWKIMHHSLGLFSALLLFLTSLVDKIINRNYNNKMQTQISKLLAQTCAFSDSTEPAEMQCLMSFLLGCPLLFYQTRIWVKIKIISANSMSTDICNAAKWSS